MAQRNITCNNQILDMELDLVHHHLHPEPRMLLGNMVALPNPSIHPPPGASGTSANRDFHQFMSPHGSNPVYGSQYNNLQNYHPVVNFEVGCVAPSGFSSNLYMAPSSSRTFSDQILSSSSHRVMGTPLDEHVMHSALADNLWGINKRKNEAVPGYCHYANGLTNPSSSSLDLSMNSGPQQLDESYDAGPSMSDVAPFLPEYRGGIQPMAEGTQESVRSRAGFVLQLDSAFMHHRNHLLQENYMAQSFQPVSSWPDHFGSSSTDGGGSNQGYTTPMPHLLGRSSNRTSIENGNIENRNIGGLLYQDPTPGRNQNPTVPHPSALYGHHLHFPPVQSMQSPNYSHYQLPPHPYGHPVNNLSIGIINASRDGLASGSRFSSPLLSNVSEGTYRPARRLHGTREYNDGRMRLLYPEHRAILDFSGFYEVENHNDLHRDMRLDIDSMTYEELLALEEHIGDVNTGLSEESILKYLKTKIHVPQIASLSIMPPCTDTESETCIICQVEFEESERVGTLDCGHEYHADCIKQWLLVKNICPICKKTALATDKRKDE